MAIIGLRIPYYAKYTFNEETGAVTYSDGGRVGRAVEYKATFTRTDDSFLYGDDMIAETAKGKFKSGELSLKTTELTQDVSKVIFGLKTKTVTVGESSVSVAVYDDDMLSPDLGFGIIETHQIKDADRFRAIVLLKTYFNVPDDAATTQGDTISWQTPEIKGVIQRSQLDTDAERRPWKYDAWFDDANDADAFLRMVLSIPETVPEG